ncbi:cytochrome P450 [Aaosphaeria arxii CBS 175.79]|uniref:Cytochrome P450 n=1 Tax=Aaosphaeria arxii CBS 175.79 TaxID=1450172 RepID=A0A6A5XL70_9PLEO|nr:cytochrome P450 [Aaosphaeria arxii CBS 175.79]KAF2013636.1 cytochrome P450 [Aaosphaeria arxii CBS 175.79]
MGSTTAYTALTLLPLIVWSLYALLRQWRFGKYAHIPKQKKPSLLLGNLKDIAMGFTRIGDPRRHFDYIAENELKEVGNPPLLYLDLRPFSYVLIVVRSYDIAEQISRVSKLHPQSVTKSPTLMTSYRALIGKKSLLTEEGDSWKALRKRFNLGFAPQHLLTLMPQILSKTKIFMAKLDALAATGEEFEMDPLCTNLTFDIIGEVAMNLDLHAQSDNEAEKHDIVRHFHTLMGTFLDTGRIWLWANIPVRIRRLLSSWAADAAIKREIKRQFAIIKASQEQPSSSSSSTKPRDRSVVALALSSIPELTPQILQSTADQVKTFLFAGHDTTSILLQRLFYALSIHPSALHTLRTEHATLFGTHSTTPAIMHAFATHPDSTIKSLPYTSACIKETLRLWPPAGTARRAAPGSGMKLHVRETGEDVCVDGCVLYLCHYLIHRDKAVYGPDAEEFRPERWLGDVDTSSTAPNRNDAAAAAAAGGGGGGGGGGGTKVPTGAWRAFERGPRNCIGQELANIEARIILACVMRRYDFEKVGAGKVVRGSDGEPVFDEEGERDGVRRYKVESELFNCMKVTAKPFDGCRMRVRRTGVS